jgi:hypothetical protein
MLGLVAAGHTNAQIARLTWRVRGNRAHPPANRSPNSALKLSIRYEHGGSSKRQQPHGPQLAAIGQHQPCDLPG